MRQNKNAVELPDVVQHKVEVLQSRHERALYLQQERDSQWARTILWVPELQMCRTGRTGLESLSPPVGFRF